MVSGGILDWFCIVSRSLISHTEENLSVEQSSSSVIQGSKTAKSGICCCREDWQTIISQADKRHSSTADIFWCIMPGWCVLLYIYRKYMYVYFKMCWNNKKYAFKTIYRWMPVQERSTDFRTCSLKVSNFCRPTQPAMTTWLGPKA